MRVLHDSPGRLLQASAYPHHTADTLNARAAAASRRSIGTLVASRAR
jgi:hypothetical protein